LRWKAADTVQKLNLSMVVTNADKGNVITVLDKHCCDSKLNKMLDDRETYIHLKSNPTASTTKKVNKFDHDLRDGAIHARALH